MNVREIFEEHGIASAPADHEHSRRGWVNKISGVRYQSLCFIGFPKYRVGDDGSFWSYRYKRGGVYRWKQLGKTKRPHKSGYIRVGLSDGNGKRLSIFIHQLVLLAFVGPCPPGWESRHFPDNNRANNNLSNLSWASKKVNMGDKVFHGTHAKGENSPRAKLTNSKVKWLRQQIKVWKGPRRQFSIRYAAKLGMSVHSIGKIVKPNSPHYPEAH